MTILFFPGFHFHFPFILNDICTNVLTNDSLFQLCIEFFCTNIYQDGLFFKQIFITGNLCNKGNDSIWDCNISVMIRKLFIIEPDVGVDSSPIFISWRFFYIFSIYFYFLMYYDIYSQNLSLQVDESIFINGNCCMYYLNTQY